MEPQFRTSFIPKKVNNVPISRRTEKGSTISVFFLISIILFILSVATAGGSYFYQKILSDRLEEKNTRLLAAKKNFEKETVDRITRFSNRIEAAKDTLKSHIVISPIFPILEEQTLDNVRFSDFSYSIGDEGVAVISLTGEAKNLNAVALQSDIFGNSPYMKDPVFSGFELNDKGTWDFKFTANIKPEVISYMDNLASVKEVIQ